MSAEVAGQPEARRPNRRERAAEESRQALLQAGSDLLVEKLRGGELDPLQLLKPTEIADRADRARAALYYFWPVSDDEPDKLAGYRRAVFLHQAWHGPFDVDGLLDEAQSHVEEPLPELVRQTANFEIERFGTGRLREGHRLATALSIAAEARNDRTYVGIRGTQEDPNSKLSDGYGELLKAYGLEMVPPLDTRHLAQMLGALLDGFAINLWCLDKVAEPVEWHESPGEWTPFALAVWAIVDKVTRPIDEGLADDESPDR